jgi:hypothetical protein
MKEFEFKIGEGKFALIAGATYEDALWTFMQWKAVKFAGGNLLQDSVSLQNVVAVSNSDGGWNYRW